MRPPRLITGPDNEQFFTALDERDFEPVAEKSLYNPPKATVDPDKKKSWIRRVWPLIKAHKGTFITSLVMSFLALLSQVQLPRLIGQAINQALPTPTHHGVLVPLSHFAFLIGGVIIIREIANYTGRRMLLTTAYAIEFDMRHNVYEHYMGLSFPFYDAVSVGQLISRANSDVRAVQQYMVQAPTVFVQCAVVLIAFVEMFFIDAPLTLVTMRVFHSP